MSIALFAVATSVRAIVVRRPIPRDVRIEAMRYAKAMPLASISTWTTTRVAAFANRSRVGRLSDVGR